VTPSDELGVMQRRYEKIDGRLDVTRTDKFLKDTTGSTEGEIVKDASEFEFCGLKAIAKSSSSRKKNMVNNWVYTYFDMGSCPNCHAILHRRNPPLSVDELAGN